MTKIQQALTALEERYLVIPASEYDLDNVCGAGEDAKELVLSEIAEPSGEETACADIAGTAAAKLRAVALAGLGLGEGSAIDLEDERIYDADNTVARELGFETASELVNAAFAEGHVA
jgi:hypothetical protein